MSRSSIHRSLALAAVFALAACSSSELAAAAGPVYRIAISGTS